MAGESAALMGITGYRRTAYEPPWLQAAATRFLRTIYEGSQPSDVRRFHGTSGQQWASVRPGQTVDLPLTATGRDRGTVGYALRGQDRDNPEHQPYLIVFPKGTATAGISHEWDENGDYRLPSWDEAVVAGRFRVKARHEVRTPGVGYYTRIELEPAEVWDPVRRRWVPPRRRRRPGHDFGEHQQLVDELRDGGAHVHDDGTVSVWRITQLNADADPTVQYTTNGPMAIDRAEWRSEPVPQEVRLPLSQVRLLFEYSDETRIAIPEARPASSPAPGGTDWAGQLAQQLRAEFPGLMLDLHRDPSGYIVLPRIKVPEQRRGTGSAVMQRIIDAADANGDTLVLSPTAEWGASLTRLTRFYRRFGFVPNKGRAKDFTTRETMIRRPGG
jgi:GNAT superfamily N-acetyltransferase